MKNTRTPGKNDAGDRIPDMERPPGIPEFRQAVLGYYHDHGRDLAWRKTTDPYHILVSEIMLQQTQVERVSVKFPAFIARFPDFGSLASAPLPEVLLAWQGMGYNRRAVFLQRSARRAAEEYDGTLPQDPDVLATFPGIGRATAASICAFAFDMPVVFIETNIRRVFIHYFFGDSATTVNDTDILPLVKKALYRKSPRTWYNALMDLGSDLKTTTENPNRRSRHYTKQAAFEGSDRKIRGSIIRILLTHKRLTRKAVIQQFTEEEERVARILSNLEAEGFIARSGAWVSIASR